MERRSVNRIQFNRFYRRHMDSIVRGISRYYNSVTVTDEVSLLFSEDELSLVGLIPGPMAQKRQGHARPCLIKFKGCMSINKNSLS